MEALDLILISLKELQDTCTLNGEKEKTITSWWPGREISCTLLSASVLSRTEAPGWTGSHLCLQEKNVWGTSFISALTLGIGFLRGSWVLSDGSGMEAAWRGEGLRSQSRLERVEDWIAIIDLLIYHYICLWYNCCYALYLITVINGSELIH